MILRILKLAVLVSGLTLILLSSGFIYKNIPIEPINFIMEKFDVAPKESINYGDVPVFMENLRFDHKNISFFIEESCESDRKSAMISAFEIFKNSVGVISFYESQGENPDIRVTCSNESIKTGDKIFKAGEGGPSKVINTSNFKVIGEGIIKLYKKSECSTPVVELHEISHVFGFDHSLDPKSILYNVSECDQKITPDMAELIQNLYSIEPLPDAVIRNLTAVKRKRYVDFNLTVFNEGLVDISNISLTIISEGDKLEEFFLNEIKVGQGRTIKMSNLRLPFLSKLDSLEFFIDYENSFKELNEDNNYVRMNLSQ
jgi:hypothetical protein